MENTESEKWEHTIEFNINKIKESDSNKAFFKDLYERKVVFIKAEEMNILMKNNDYDNKNLYIIESHD